jgi:hypothetical protein
MSIAHQPVGRRTDELPGSLPEERAEQINARSGTGHILNNASWRRAA